MVGAVDTFVVVDTLDTVTLVSVYTSTLERTKLVLATGRFVTVVQAKFTFIDIATFVLLGTGTFVSFGTFAGETFFVV